MLAQLLIWESGWNTGVSDQCQTPEVNQLLTNFPNPFQTATTISFRLAQDCSPQIRIYNSKGQLVRNLNCEKLKSGFNTISWDGKDDQGHPVSAGIYLSKLSASGDITARKLLLMK
jgi:flagellar hook assembly protein FlgD